jgi:hypothetical protein
MWTQLKDVLPNSWVRKNNNCYVKFVRRCFPSQILRSMRSIADIRQKVAQSSYCKERRKSKANSKKSDTNKKSKTWEANDTAMKICMKLMTANQRGKKWSKFDK